nr:Pcdhb11 protein [Mus musculus]
MVDKLVTEHKRTWNSDQPPRDLTDAFMAEMEKAKGNPESSFNDANLCLVVLDLLGAATVTTSTTLSWALLLMILHPDVQCEPGWGCQERRRRVEANSLNLLGTLVDPSIELTQTAAKYNRKSMRSFGMCGFQRWQTRSACPSPMLSFMRA